MAETKLSLNLWIIKDSNKVLFAEAGKDFVDFLFNLFSLPLGQVFNLLKDCVNLNVSGNQLYQSLVSLNDSYMNGSEKKNLVLKPSVLRPVRGVPKLFPVTTGWTVYACSHGLSFSSDYCRQCGRYRDISRDLSLFLPASDGGYVKEMVYMVMDDLSVKPMTTMEILNVFAPYKVDPNGACEQKVVQFGRHEAIKLLGALLISEKTALSAIYSVKTEPSESSETINSS